MAEPLSTVAKLRQKHRAVRKDDQPVSPFALRTYRAIRWLHRAAREHEEPDSDPDVAFILYWIAFNAAYAKDVSNSPRQARDEFEDYFERLLSLDRDGAIHDSIWEKFSGPVRVLLTNKYLYDPFWDHANGKPGNENWASRFQEDLARVNRALGKRTPSSTKTLLKILFQRLYTLRNQLVHGGASWNSSINRDTVTTGARIMEFLVPVFVEIMLDNPDEDWGPPYYRLFPALRAEQRSG